MLKRVLQYDKSAIGTRLRKFGLSLRDSPPSLSRANKLLFLCGGNRGPETPSARRETIKRFVESLSNDYRVVYGEGVFEELTKIGHNKNVLDLEHEISDIADSILIVLESPSAFCELGAFAHQKFRKKLVVINDSQFKSSKSFINTGPIAAATEAKSPVLWYPMKPSGIHTADGVGATFMALKAAIESKTSPRATQLSHDFAELSANKTSLYFVHDLVLLAGPISHQEIVEILIALFGQKNYDMLKRLLGVLRAAELVRSYEVGDQRVYQSSTSKTFMRYGMNVLPMMAAFRRFHLRENPARFDGK